MGKKPLDANRLQLHFTSNFEDKKEFTQEALLRRVFWLSARIVRIFRWMTISHPDYGIIQPDRAFGISPGIAFGIYAPAISSND